MLRRHDVSDVAMLRALDRWLVNGVISSRGTTRLTTVRTPMPPGKSTRFLNRVDIKDAGDPVVRLVEKAVRNDSWELSFWRGTWPGPILSAESYNTVSLVDLYVGDPVSVMYFPYVPALDRDKKILQREFRSNLEQIAAAVADFNGHNMSNSSSPTRRQWRFEPVRPTESDLQVKLRITAEEARAVLGAWDEGYAAWRAIQPTLAGLSWCLCHFDVSPGNSTFSDNVLTIADFGLAGHGPVGSDLHTLIRWSGRAIADSSHVDGLLTAYVDRMRAYDKSINLDDVRRAAWATFFLRYTNLKFSSARYLDIYRLAIQRMIEVGRLPAVPSGDIGTP